MNQHRLLPAQPMFIALNNLRHKSFTPMALIAVNANETRPGLMSVHSGSRKRKD